MRRKEADIYNSMTEHETHQELKEEERRMDSIINRGNFSKKAKKINYSGFSETGDFAS